MAEAARPGRRRRSLRGGGGALGSWEVVPFVCPRQPLRPLLPLRPSPLPFSRTPPPGPCGALPPLFCLDLGEEGQRFPGRAPPLRPSAPALVCAAVPDWLRDCACAEAARPVVRRALPSLSLRSSEPVRKMPAAVTGCGGPAPRVLRPCRRRRRRHYGAPSGECAEPRPALRRFPAAG